MAECCMDSAMPDSLGAWAVKAEDGSMEEIPKLHNVKERNRRAQKKYREKLKEKEDALEENVGQLGKELQRVLQERQKLEVYNLSLMESYESTSQAAATPLEEQPCIFAEGKEDFASALARKSGVRLTISCQRTYTHEELETFTSEDFVKFHEMVYNKGQTLLAQNPNWDPDCPAGKELQALVWEKHGMSAYLAGGNRLMMHRRMSLKIGGPEHILDLALEAAHLENNQKRYLRENRELMITTLHRLHEERAALQQRVAEIESNGEFASGSIAALQFHWAQIAQALQDNIDKEHVAFCRFYAMVWLPPDEIAMLCAVYPFFPDIAALVDKAGPPDDRPILLDADASTETLMPAAQLPDPTVDRYEPLQTKLTNAIRNLKLFDDMIKGQAYART